MDTLFSGNLKQNQPLAEQLRPKTLNDFVGQSNLVGEKGVIRAMIERDQLVSMIFWGPPGTGKTTLATIIAESTGAKFVSLSAVSAGVKELRVIIDQAKTDKELHNQRTVLFVDEIHRWNKSQQDALLPFIEQGIITLIGATTENPSFELNNALLSRCQVFVFDKLIAESLKQILQRALQNLHTEIAENVEQLIINMADGDARVVLNTIELLKKTHSDLSNITKQDVKQILEKVALRYDKAGEEHYNIISALHKTMRASDVNAALYWCGRMLFAGEDPLYVMRRVVEFATEDIGLADPQAVQVCVAAYQAAHFMGMPECQYAIFEAVAYCARAPKSRAVYNAAKQVERDIRDTPNSPVPMQLRNLPAGALAQEGAPTKLMQQLGYHEDQGEANLPPHLRDKKYLL